jgi:hypothetical protein
MFGFQEAFKMTEFTCEQAVGRISPHRYPFFRQSVRRNQRQRRITVYAAAQPERSCEGNKRVIIQKPLIMSGFVAQTSPLAENWLCLAQSLIFRSLQCFQQDGLRFAFSAVAILPGQFGFVGQILVPAAIPFIEYSCADC